MKLDIYAGKKKITTLVPHFDVAEDRSLKEWCGNYAVPGGKKADEKTVREWANEYGFSVKKRYEFGDGYAEDFRTVGLGQGEPGDYSVCSYESPIPIS